MTTEFYSSTTPEHIDKFTFSKAASYLGKVFFILTFLLILTLPLFQMYTNTFLIPATNENRNLAAPPSLDKMQHPTEFISQGQKWFDDHYGFRDLLIRVKAEIDYRLFHVSDHVYIGKDDWLIYKDVIEVEQPLVNALTDKQLSMAMTNLAALRDYLAKRDIKLIVITTQLKDTFYPEFFPELAPMKRHNRFNDFREKMHAFPGITYIDATEILMKLKQKRPIFHKTDTHWNEPAAAEIAAILVDKIAAAENKPVPFWRVPLKIAERDFIGGESNSLPLFNAIIERGLFIDRTPPYTYTEKTNNKALVSITRMTSKKHNLLPPTLMYSDSFVGAMYKAGLPDHFSVLYSAHTDTPLSTVLTNLPSGTRYFVYQFIESKLIGLVYLFQQNGELISESEYKQRISSLIQTLQNGSRTSQLLPKTT